MALSTKQSKNGGAVLDKRTKIANLREKHEPLFEQEGVGSEARFIPKVAYIPRGGEERVLAFFKSELQAGCDIYTEFVNFEYEPDTPTRTLYKWEHNPHWEEEYEATEPHEKTGHRRWLVPVEELVEVEELAAAEVPTADEDGQFQLFDPNSDAPMKAMTMRDHCAIKWKKPVSHKRWLNELIKSQF